MDAFHDGDDTRRQNAKEDSLEMKNSTGREIANPLIHPRNVLKSEILLHFHYIFCSSITGLESLIKKIFKSLKSQQKDTQK